MFVNLTASDTQKQAVKTSLPLQTDATLATARLEDAGKNNGKSSQPNANLVPNVNSTSLVDTCWFFLHSFLLGPVGASHTTAAIWPLDEVACAKTSGGKNVCAKRVSVMWPWSISSHPSCAKIAAVQASCIMARSRKIKSNLENRQAQIGSKVQGTYRTLQSKTPLDMCFILLLPTIQTPIPYNTQISPQVDPNARRGSNLKFNSHYIIYIIDTPVN